MWQTLLQHDVLVGATLVAIYEVAKFTELNLADPITRRYIALLPGVTVRDFTSAYAYYGALVSFIGVSLLICRTMPAFAGSPARRGQDPDQRRSAGVARQHPLPALHRRAVHRADPAGDPGAVRVRRCAAQILP